MSNGVPLWHSGHLRKTQPLPMASFNGRFSNLPHTRQTAMPQSPLKYVKAREHYGGRKVAIVEQKIQLRYQDHYLVGAVVDVAGKPARPSADAYRRNVSTPDTTILALMTRISMPTREIAMLASITRPLSRTRSRRSNKLRTGR